MVFQRFKLQMSTTNTSTAQTVRYLSGAFAAKSRVLKNDNRVGSDLHAAQVDFSYLIDDIQRGPTYMVPKAIAAANALIDSLPSS